MDLGLKGRVALVAAASGGIGYASALELAREGARLFICSRDEGRVGEAAAKIRAETGAEVEGIAADVTSDADAERFVGRASDAAGRVDVLVTNAGGSPGSTFAETELEMYRRAFELNALSAIRLAHLVVPLMRGRRWGRVVNVTSISVKQPITGLLLSNTVRAGLTGWAKTLSNEVAADGVTVNNVAPGWTLTARQEQHAVERGARTGKTKDEMIEGWTSEVPLRRMARPEEIAAAVVFLASERASYITGQTVVVDGGWVKGLF
ncbi:MAG TPA: SDR family oxidoreductase [Pyrinomonadaceae bacterium]|nr:SDR family oxidoreductase [Pyrinomonadaceae bacterium]